MRTLRVASYNIHKGLSYTPFLNRRLTIHELREKLRVLGADIVFLQEVRGRHDRQARRYENWPAAPQYEPLARTPMRRGSRVYSGAFLPVMIAANSRKSLI